ncbi:nucleotidyltransferase family protein [Pseudoroseicyclus aestuarii]|nr:nucleotidyltransferase family protein [Pseudoroseicyclus aestuarii]
MPATPVPLLLLAAGRSSRMRGRDKLAEVVEGEPLLRRIARHCIEAGAEVHVALPDADHPRRRLLEGLSVTPLFLPASAEGMGGTLRAGVAALPPAAQIAVLPADLPELLPDDIRYVLQAPAIAPQALIWRGTSQDGRPGHPVLFDASLRPQFQELRGDEGAAAIVRAQHDRLYLLPLPEERAIRDLDTPEAWAQWRQTSGNG